MIQFRTFIKRFKPQLNHLTQNGNEEYLFGDTGEELAYVKAQNPLNVWTLIEGDNNRTYIVEGFHYIGVWGFLISETPCPKNENFCISYLN